MVLDQILLGSAVITVECFDSKDLCNKLLSVCRVISLTLSDEKLVAKVHYTELRYLLKLIDKENLNYTVSECKGVLYRLSRYSKRYGIFTGVIIAIALVIYLSNIVMDIRINCEYADEETISDVLAVMNDLGVCPGAFIPSINCMKIEAEIFEAFEDISWVSVGSEGSKIIVNLTLAPAKVEYQTKRVPSNIVASREGVIVNANVLAGELSVLIGDAVSKGEILISGIVERRNGITYYYHSIGEVIAEFEQSYTIEQNYIDIVQTNGDVTYKTHLKFYDYILGNRECEYDNFSEESIEHEIKFFGIKSPISVCNFKITEIREDITVYDKEAVTTLLYKKIDTLENELLKKYEIVERDFIITYDENGGRIVANYKLRGDIGTQQIIFAH